MKKYKVQYWSDGNYAVIKISDDENVFIGSLSDCEAYIRLEEQGYM